MDGKKALEEMLAKVDANKRDEACARLAAVETRAEKLAIFEDYGVKVDEVFGEGWEAKAHELSDEELDQMAGGDIWDAAMEYNSCIE